MNPNKLNKLAGGNTKTPASSKRYCFTYNNWDPIGRDKLISEFEVYDGMYIMGEEIAPGTGTPHLQGYVEFERAVCFATIKDWNVKIHWQSCNKKGTREKNVAYCSKEGTNILSTFPLPLKVRLLAVYDDVKWKRWQQSAIDIVESPRETRKLHWYWEDIGNVGKSFLVKYLYLKYDAIICEGKKGDVLQQLRLWMEEHPEESPKCVVCDIPRTSLDYVSYQVLETLKNGLAYSGKYEGGVCAIEPPHIVCFANEAPKMEKVSSDRWEITQIGRIKRKRAILKVEENSE